MYGDKPGGLIVDLLGLADQLADALATYTQAGGTGKAVRKPQDEAVPAMQAAFEKLQSFFHGCDYEQALDAAPKDVLPVYPPDLAEGATQLVLRQAKLSNVNLG